MNYYNEHDNNVAAWIEELVASGDLPPGLVDSRDVQAINGDDLLHQYDQCHFFAGIGGWSHALDLAGWPRDKPIWTASLPCQPFSDAGKQLGVKDERHLWPVFRDLVAHYRPERIIGEQVASKAGREWFASVQTDLEDLGYWCGAIDICAASCGAPHIRQRLFWCAVRMGHADGSRQQGLLESQDRPAEGQQFRGAVRDGSSGDVPRDSVGGVADNNGERLPQRQERDGEPVGPRQQAPLRRDTLRRGTDDGSPWADVVYVPCSDGKARPLPRKSQSCPEQVADGLPGILVRGGDYCTPEIGGGEEGEAQDQTPVAGWPTPNTTEGGLTSRSGDRKDELLVGGIVRGITAPLDLAAFHPLVSEPSEGMNNTNEARTMRLRGYGNAIVAPLAAEFIRAFMDILDDIGA